MTMAAAIESRTAKAPAWSRTSRIASVDIVHDLGEAEAVWRGLEAERQFSTPYQRFDFLAPWQRQVGERDNLLPFIVVAYDAERRPLVLLPLALSHKRGVRSACFMGGKHATFNMALSDSEFAAAAIAADLDALISGIRQWCSADVLALTQQPLRWRDLPNPMALLPSQASATDCPLLTMVPGAVPATLISNSFRRRLKGKERKLQRLPGYRYHVAASEADVQRLLDWFLSIKPLRMAEQKLPNVFAEPGFEDFVRSACMAKLYRPFFILGEVAAPGQYPYVPNMSVESAVAIAGGFSPRALRDRVTLTHTDGSGSSRIVAPLGTALSPGDTVLVGERWF
jgi:CelD/BcsL family acetyltransferase involved in cellulose biosynthesis